VEELVNGYILSNYKLSAKEMTLAVAKKIGALAFFQEKYGNKVRVVSVSDISQELCGGTHLNSTGEIGVFKILQESSIASGIRRIEAATGNFAYEIFKNEERTLRDICGLLNVPPDKIVSETQKRLSRVKELEKQIESKTLSAAQGSIDTLIAGAAKINEIKLITKVIDNLNMDVLRRTMDLIKQKADNSVIALGSASLGGKALLIVGVTADLCAKGVDANKIIGDIAKIIGGSGGGRCDLAQAGGSKPENFEAAFAELKNLMAKQ
jgi:alanyl-tRNA synthetase